MLRKSRSAGCWVQVTCVTLGFIRGVGHVETVEQTLTVGNNAYLPSIAPFPPLTVAKCA
jgi:hypothetical protein